MPEGTPKSGDSTARRTRAAQAREAQKRAERRRRISVWTAVVVVVAAVAGGITAVELNNSGGHSPAKASLTGPMGPEGVALEEGTPLAALTSAATGTTTDGVQCNTQEQVAYHIHAHLTVFVNGALRPVTPGIGIVAPVAQQSANGAFYGATSCYYWLHVHAQDGVIHIESPTAETYTLGQFFAIWGQPLSQTQVGPAKGTQTVYVDGKAYTGNPADIELHPREDIQIDVGTVVAPRPVDWSKSQL
jgi:hypothetical protein